MPSGDDREALEARLARRGREILDGEAAGEGEADDNVPEDAGLVGRLREIAKIAAAHRASDGVSRESGAGPVAGATDPTATSVAPPGVARFVGGYRIVREIGRGGMGVVFEAEQQNPRRAVALKLIRSTVTADETAVRMFRREVQTLARLKHPSIAAIYEAGRTPDGEHYFAMELVRGETLFRHLQASAAGERLPAAEVRRRLRLFCKICDAVAYAHQRGVIHRDLKPANILVVPPSTRSGPEGADEVVPEIKILDFGLARMMDADLGLSTVVTEHGHVFGTLPYMSPEQVRGNSDEIDVRSDVYSLGVILYEMLTGTHPSALREVSLVEAARRICEVPPVPLRRVWRGEKRLDPDLETIVAKSLEKETANRYQSATTLSGDIERYLGQQPIVARPPSGVYQFRKLIARHRTVFALTATIGAVLLASSVSLAILARRISLERDRTRDEAATSREVADFLVGLFEVSDPGEARGNTVTAREILDRGATRITNSLGDRPLVQSRLMDTMGRVYLSLGLHEVSIPLHEKAVAVSERTEGPESVETAGRLLDLGNAYRIAGRLDEAESVLRRSLEIKERLLPEDAPDLAATLTSLGATIHDRGRVEDAVPLYERSIAILEEHGPRETRRLATSLMDLANARTAMGAYAEAEPLYERAMSLCDSELGRDHPQTQAVLINLAKLLLNDGRYREAEERIRANIVTLEGILGPQHPTLALSLQNLGWARVAQGSAGDAEALLRRALELLENAYGGDDPRVARVLNDLGWILYTAGRLDEAEPLMRRSAGIKEMLLGPESPDLALTLMNLATIQQDRGQLADTEALELRALAIQERALGPDHPSTAMTVHNLGNLRSLQGRFDEADALLDRATRSWEKSLHPQHPNVAMALLNRGLLAARRGRGDEGVGMLKRAAAIYEGAFGARSPQAAVAMYNLACAQALSGERRAAVESLREAMDRGYSGGDPRMDPDLASLAADPAFKALFPGTR